MSEIEKLRTGARNIMDKSATDGRQVAGLMWYTPEGLRKYTVEHAIFFAMNSQDLYLYSHYNKI